MMVKKLIINADDFGMTEGMTKGIIDSHADGVVTSTTLMMNALFTEYAVRQAVKYPDLGVGIHLTLTYGRPLVAGAKSFTDLEGNFLKIADYPDGFTQIDPQELYIEWKAQLELFIQMMGKLPTHIDSHHHVHCDPHHHDVIARLVSEYDLPLRAGGKVVDHYESTVLMLDFYGEDLTVSSMTNELEKDIEILEVMCHPAYLDQVTYDLSSYNLPRMKEMEILRSKELREFILRNEIELITFADLKKRS